MALYSAFGFNMGLLGVWVYLFGTDGAADLIYVDKSSWAVDPKRAYHNFCYSSPFYRDALAKEEIASTIPVHLGVSKLLNEYGVFEFSIPGEVIAAYRMKITVWFTETKQQRLRKIIKDTQNKLKVGIKISDMKILLSLYSFRS